MGIACPDRFELGLPEGHQRFCAPIGEGYGHERFVAGNALRVIRYVGEHEPLRFHDFA